MLKLAGAAVAGIGAVAPAASPALAATGSGRTRPGQVTLVGELTTHSN